MRPRILLPCLILASSLAAGPLPVHEVRDLRYLGGGIADSFRGRIQGQKYALKPMERFGENPYGGFGQANPEAELVCLPLMRALGLKAPEAMLFRPGPEAPMVLAVSWVDETLTGGPVEQARLFLNVSDLSHVDRDAFARMFVADILIGNPDRHGGNYFLWTDADGVVRPVPIDHNLALEPGGFPGGGASLAVAPPFFDRACVFAAQLNFDPDWGERMVEAAEFVHATLTPEVLEGAVDRVPEAVPAPRRAFLREYLLGRREQLLAAAHQWRAGWTPARPPPEGLPTLVGRLAQIARWSPQAAIRGLVLFHQILSRDPGMEEEARRFLMLPETFPRGPGLLDYFDSMARAHAEAFETDLETLREQLRAYSHRFADCGAVARETLVRIRDLDPRDASGRIGPILLEAAWNGRPDLLALFQELVRADRSNPVSLGAWTWLRVVREMGDTVGEPGFRARLGRLAPLLGAYSDVLGEKADESKIRFQAKALTLGRLGRLLARLVPEARPSQVEAALVRVLGHFPRRELRRQDGRWHPGALALALRLTAHEAGKRWSRKRFWAALETHGARGRAPWLAGWAGPVLADDVQLSVHSLQAVGFHADSASRILFERLSRGPYGTWRDLAGRVLDADVQAQIWSPGRETPPTPRLFRGKGFLTPWTAPSQAIRTGLDESGTQLAVTIEIEGLEPVTAASIPVERTPEGRWLVSEDAPDLDLSAGAPLPQEWTPISP